MRCRVLSILAVLMLECGSVSAEAQPAGAVSGSVADETGARLPGVRVTIRGAVERTVETGADGGFAFPGLPESDYALRVAFLDETVVTAMKTGERTVQTTPLAVSAVSDAPGIEAGGHLAWLDATYDDYIAVNNLNVADGPANRRWALAAYARNLMNEDYVTATFGTVPTAFGGRPGPPRQVSINLTVRR